MRSSVIYRGAWYGVAGERWEAVQRVSSGFELLPRSVSMEGVESTREKNRKKKKKIERSEEADRLLEKRNNFIAATS